MRRILDPVIVRKVGFGNVTLTFHPSHDMGSLFCRDCGAWGAGDRKARRPCKAPHESGIGL